MSINPDVEVVHQLEARDSINNCEDSSFVNQSSGGSPFISDCQQIVRNIAGGGSWTVPLTFYRKLVSHGTCAFGAQAQYDFRATNAKIGNQDIMDLINDSIRRFSWNGRVGSKGEMQCQYDPRQHLGTVSWGLYHN
ncbi:putative necrosis-inducing factor-domain-containing protein [Stachybotrys elegans]|uniref:Necrosis-inducing factor-domain-containing protein n=1 Tax=Stachybotrys elegans TaxID=80388 RepID=A0A8K0SD70_9HYPO|nr:putative necrosis-inducing factor-domain-containing protein [Stachybotrys elegans]